MCKDLSEENAQAIRVQILTEETHSAWAELTFAWLSLLLCNLKQDLMICKGGHTAGMCIDCNYRVLAIAVQVEAI